MSIPNLPRPAIPVRSIGLSHGYILEDVQRCIDPKPGHRVIGVSLFHAIDELVGVFGRDFQLGQLRPVTSLRIIGVYSVVVVLLWLMLFLV